MSTLRKFNWVDWLLYGWALLDASAGTVGGLLAALFVVCVICFINEVVA